MSIQCVIEVLVNLHKNQWDEELLDNHFFPSSFLSKVLSSRERQIIGMKVNGLVNGEIASILGIEIITVRRMLCLIKKKYREGMDTRVDDWKVIRREKRKDNK